MILCDNPRVHFPDLADTDAPVVTPAIGICLLCYTAVVPQDQLDRRGRCNDGIELIRHRGVTTSP